MWVVILAYVTFLIFFSSLSFPSANKYANISLVLEKWLLLTPLHLTAISPFLCMALYQKLLQKVLYTR